MAENFIGHEYTFDISCICIDKIFIIDVSNWCMLSYIFLK